MNNWDSHIEPHYQAYERTASRIVAGLIIVPLVGTPLVWLVLGIVRGTGTAG